MISFKPSTVHGMHPGRCATVEVGGKSIGFVAEVDPDAVKRDLDAPASVGRIAVFELDAEVLMSLTTDNRRYQFLPKYPAVNRDLAVAVDLAVNYGEIEHVAKDASDEELVEELTVQSIYTGEKVSPGKKSVAIRLTFRAPDRTLTDAEVDAQMTAVENALVDAVGAARR